MISCVGAQFIAPSGMIAPDFNATNHNKKQGVINHAPTVGGIVRSEPELHKIREYIINNPLNWEADENYRN